MLPHSQHDYYIIAALLVLSGAEVSCGKQSHSVLVDPRIQFGAYIYFRNSSEKKSLYSPSLSAY